MKSWGKINSRILLEVAKLVNANSLSMVPRTCLYCFSKLCISKNITYCKTQKIPTQYALRNKEIHSFTWLEIQIQAGIVSSSVKTGHLLYQVLIFTILRLASFSGWFPSVYTIPFLTSWNDNVHGQKRAISSFQVFFLRGRQPFPLPLLQQTSPASILASQHWVTYYVKGPQHP